LFTLMTLLPFLLLAGAFLFFVQSGRVAINLDLLFWSVIIVGLFAFIGFLSMRKTFMNLMTVSKDAKDILAGDLTKRINIKGSGSNEVTELAKTFNGVVQQLESNIKQLEKSRSMLQGVLLRVASGVSSAENIDAFLDLILETTVDALDGKRGLLLLIDEEKKELIIKSSFGLGAAYLKDSRIPIDDEVVSWVIKQKKPLLIPRLHKIASVESTSAAFEPPLICTPLMFQGRIIGAISVSGKKQDTNFEEDELIVLSNLASQVALALENSRLNYDNQKTYLETVTALALAVEARDTYSRGHSDRVSICSVKIAQALGLEPQRIKAIKEAAQLHDVGKIGISDDILKKPGFLNDFERKIIQQHPVIGEGIIVPLHGFLHLRDPIRHHHEWLNGEGYPDHLKGDEISLESRILTVSDSFDAMTTDRPYRKGLTLQQVKEELLRYVDSRYDKRVVDALIASQNIP
ncbi:MAG: HD domain-containing phosphohydrolase, partial [Candidatus Omnitrophota bacterium]